MRNNMGIIYVAILFQVLVLSSASPHEPSSAKHSVEYCAMYGICGQRSDGKVLNCPYGSPSVTPDDLLSAKIQSLCPSITGNVCCSEVQFDTLREQVQQAVPILVGCPACLRNFLNLFCELSCSPNQSLFINVTSTSEVNGNITVDGIDFYTAETFGDGLYKSCKDVKFGTMNTRAIDFVGGGASNFEELFAFLGQKVAPGFPGSPYSINFKTTIPDSSPMELMNASVYSCNDTSLGCSCGDCPSSPVCSHSEPSPPRKDPCSIRIGPLKVRCLDLSLAIVYVILVFMLFGWVLLQRKRLTRRPGSNVEPLLTDTVGEGINFRNLQKDDSHPVENVVQFSFLQECLSSFYRTYGRWAARRPTAVLCSSLAVVLLLCLGLLRFKVETRPEKLWVGPGSKAAEEKDFFDSHLAPFYRIEQLIIATIPESEHGRPPSIMTEDNIELLFEMQEKVDGIRANYSGSLVSLSDICLKPLGEDCATQSILQYFQMDPDNYDNYGGVEHAEYCFQHYTSTETCFSAFKAPLEPTTALGGFSGNNYSEASAFIITYPVNNAISKVGDENGKAIAWEKAFIQLAKEELLPMVQSSNLTLSFSAESSIEEELKRESTADVITILVSYIVMFAYISVTLGDTPRHLSSFYLSSKVLLGLSGVLLVMLSVLGSVGFFSAIGVKSTLIIMEVIPFLVLAVGVDNMCIIVDAVKRQPSGLPIEDQISNAMGEVGPSITLASSSEILAFAVGSFVSMPACRVFSMMAALAVLLDFLLQITAFVPLVTLDFMRAKDNRIDCFPCIKVNSSSLEQNEGIRQERDGLLTRFMKEVHAPFLGLWGVKILVIAIFFAFTLASIALCTRIEPGLEQQIALPRDSYLQGYFSNISEYLRVGPPLYFVVKDYNYSLESNHTNQLCSISRCDSNSLLNEISRASLVPKSSYIAKPAASWLDDFLVWLSPEAFSCCRKFTNGSYCPPDDQPPCCLADEGPCGLDGVCRDCTTGSRHSDLVNDLPSTVQFREKLPWFLDALLSADCAKAQKVPKEGWVMQDGTPRPRNNTRDHPGMIQVFLGQSGGLDSEGYKLPRLVYASREKRPGFQHHKKAGAMNALVRVSAALTNGPFLLNLDCDHYINNSKKWIDLGLTVLIPNYTVKVLIANWCESNNVKLVDPTKSTTLYQGTSRESPVFAHSRSNQPSSPESARSRSFSSPGLDDRFASSDESSVNSVGQPTMSPSRRESSSASSSENQTHVRTVSDSVLSSANFPQDTQGEDNSAPQRSTSQGYSGEASGGLNPGPDAGGATAMPSPHRETELPPCLLDTRSRSQTLYAKLSLHSTLRTRLVSRAGVLLGHQSGGPTVEEKNRGNRETGEQKRGSRGPGEQGPPIKWTYNRRNRGARES